MLEYRYFHERNDGWRPHWGFYLAQGVSVALLGIVITVLLVMRVPMFPVWFMVAGSSIAMLVWKLGSLRREVRAVRVRILPLLRQRL